MLTPAALPTNTLLPPEHKQHPAPSPTATLKLPLLKSLPALRPIKTLYPEKPLSPDAYASLPIAML